MLDLGTYWWLLGIRRGWYGKESVTLKGVGVMVMFCIFTVLLSDLVVMFLKLFYFLKAF